MSRDWERLKEGEKSEWKERVVWYVYLLRVLRQIEKWVR